MFLCMHIYVLTPFTNGSRGIIALAQFGCPPKWCRKSLLQIVLNWTIKICPGTGFIEPICIVWHILLFFCRGSIFLHVCGRHAQESIWRVIFLSVGLHFWKGNSVYDQNLFLHFCKWRNNNVYSRHQWHMISDNLWKRTWGNYWLEKLVYLGRDQRGKT